MCSKIHIDFSKHQRYFDELFPTVAGLIVMKKFDIKRNRFIAFVFDSQNLLTIFKEFSDFKRFTKINVDQ